MHISMCKLEESAPNNQPAKEDFLASVKKYITNGIVYVDLFHDSCWINDENTVVFVLNKYRQCNAISIMAFMHEMRPDEFDYWNVGKKFAIRMWWD